jgi:tetratricopeptide (TPR) repeat protein/predicted Ser/Thr protein kinase
VTERGASVGRYVLLERLGAGGMGVVFAAWDPELDRRVAIKLISDRSPKLHRQLQARLRREAQAMARLAHPNVVQVYDAGAADERLFIAMEYVDGISLRRWLQAAPRSGPEIVAAFRQAGEGLAAAHAQGVIHRDFKPDNVLVANDGRVLVVDFGLASWATSDSSGASPGESEPEPEELDEPDDEPEPPEPPDDRTHYSTLDSSGGVARDFAQTEHGNLTVPGAVLGTPAYMAPEQHRGQPTNTHSDQFSFCAALWEALNGRLPFGRGALVLARARTEKIGEWQRRDVPASVERALRRGLIWNPEQRWPDMRALLDALDPPRRRHRWVTVAVPVLAIGLGLAAAQLGGESRHANPASCEDGQLRASRVWSESNAHALAFAFGQRGRLAEQTWPYVRAELDRWTASWVAVDRDLCHRYGPLAGIDGGARQEQLACLDRQLGHLEQLVEVLATVSEAEIPKSFDLLATLQSPERCRTVGSALEREPPQIDADELTALDGALARGELELRLSRLASVDEASARLLEQSDVAGLEPQHQRAAKLRAKLLVAQRHAELAIDVAISGLEAAERSGDPLLRLDALLDVANIHAEASETIAAHRWLRQARALASALVLDRSVRARLAAVEARVAMIDGRFAEAIAAWDRALAATDPEQDRFEYIEWLHHRATILFLAKREDEGLAQLYRCEQMYADLTGKLHIKRLEVRMDIAHTQEKLGKFEDSRASYLAVAADMEEAHGGPTDLSIASRSHAAALLGMLGDCDGARAEFDPLMPVARELMATPSAVLGNLLRRRTGLCGYATPDAVDYATQTVAMYREALTEEHKSTAGTHAELGIALLVTGELERARVEAEQALVTLAKLDPEGKDPNVAAVVDNARAVVMLVRHRLGEPEALADAPELLARLDQKTQSGKRLAEELAQVLP